MRDRSTVISLLLIVSACCVSAVAIPHLPASVPTHWSLSGIPDRFGGRFEAALAMPLIMLGLLLGLKLLPRYDRMLINRFFPDASDPVSERAVYGPIIPIVLAVLLAVHLFSMGCGVGLIPASRAPSLGALIASVSAICIGNYLPRVTRRNAFIGVRLSWSLTSEEVWRKTQRVGGYGLVAAGIIGIIGAVVAPSAPLMPLALAMSVQVVFVVIYSYHAAHPRSAR